jgi:hypothetical protein
MSTQANLNLSSPTQLSSSASNSSTGGGSTGASWQSAPVVPPRSLAHVPLEPCANRAMQLHVRRDDTRQLRDFSLLQQVEPFAVQSRAVSSPQFAHFQRPTPQKFEHARCEMQILDEAVRVSQSYLAHGAAAFESPQAFEQQRDQHRRLQQALRASRVIVRESMTALNLGVPSNAATGTPANDGNDEQLRILYTELGMEHEDEDDYGELALSPARAARVVSPGPAEALARAIRPMSPQRPMSPTNLQRPMSPTHAQRPMSPGLAQSPPRLQHRPTSPTMPSQRRPPEQLHRSAPLVAMVEQKQQQQQQQPQQQQQQPHEQLPVQQSPVKKLTSAPKPAHLPLPKFEATALPDVPTSPRGPLSPRAHGATFAGSTVATAAAPAPAALASSAETSNYAQLPMSQAPMSVESELDRFRVARMSMGPKSATLFRVMALWAFDNGGNHRKLSFAKGEHLDVVSVVSDAWLHAVNHAGIEGLIPTNRVQKL